MEIVAIDEDNLADGTGKAHITWICKDLLPTVHNMNSTNTTNGSYTATSMKTYLTETILPTLPSDLQDAIVEVSKVHGTPTLNGKTSTEKLWIPSDYEVGLGTVYENTGARYDVVFTDDASRVKYRNGSTSDWWLRSAVNANNFRCVVSGGYGSGVAASSARGVVPGFCT